MYRGWTQTDYQNKHYNINQKYEGSYDDRGRDGGTNFILRIKEQEARLTLQEHDDDDDDDDDIYCRSLFLLILYIFLQSIYKSTNALNKIRHVTSIKHLHVSTPGCLPQGIFWSGLIKVAYANLGLASPSLEYDKDAVKISVSEILLQILKLSIYLFFPR